MRVDVDEPTAALLIRLGIFTVGLLAAVTLALFDSSYTGEAFALLGGVLGGSALTKIDGTSSSQD